MAISALHRFWLVTASLAIASCSTEAERDFPDFLAERAVVVDLDGIEMCCITIGDIHDNLAGLTGDVEVRPLHAGYVMTARGGSQSGTSWFFAPYEAGGYWLQRIDSEGYQIANAGGLRGYANTNQMLIQQFPQLERDEVGTKERRAAAAEARDQRALEYRAQMEQRLVARNAIADECQREAKAQFTGTAAFSAEMRCKRARGY